MEVALTYGRLMKKPGLKTFDAEATLLGPFVLIMSLMSYLLSPFVFAGLSGSVILILTLAGWLVLTASLVLAAIAMCYVAKPKRKQDLLWFPFLYAYWSLQVFLATWALIKILFHAPREWKRTVKTGIVCTADANIRTQFVNCNAPWEKEPT